MGEIRDYDINLIGECFQIIHVSFVTFESYNSHEALRTLCGVRSKLNAITGVGMFAKCTKTFCSVLAKEKCVICSVSDKRESDVTRFMA